MMPNPSHWRLSIQVANLLRQDPKLLTYLDRERCKSPFPINYSPQYIEVFYDHELCIKVDKNEVFVLRSTSRGHMHQVIEVFFDGKLAMFLINSEIVVDRTSPPQIINRILHRHIVKPISA